MKVTTLSGTVENGQIRLAAGIRFPENATVYVVIPGVEFDSQAFMASPRLLHPEQAVDFQKEVVEEDAAAGVLREAVHPLP